MANIIVQVLENMNTKEFMKQKEWLAEQVAALEPSGSEATRNPELYGCDSGRSRI